MCVTHEAAAPALRWAQRQEPLINQLAYIQRMIDPRQGNTPGFELLQQEVDIAGLLLVNGLHTKAEYIRVNVFDTQAQLLHTNE